MERIQNQDLAGVARLLAQSGVAPWPELSAPSDPLALQVHARIKQLEGAQPPDLAAVPARVQLYADLAHRFRTARGYANYVLADTLQTLSILHLARLVTSDSSRASECAALLQSLDFPVLTSETFQEIYRAKLGPTAQLDSATAGQMLDTMKRLGDAGDGFLPVSLDAVRNIGTGALLARVNPAGFIFRLSATEIVRRAALPELIEFLRKGGRLEDINLADVRNYRKLIPDSYAQRTFGVLTAVTGIAQVQQLVAAANDPDSDLLLWALDGPRRAVQSRFRVKEQRIGKLSEFPAGYLMGFHPASTRYYLVAVRGSKRVLVTEHGESGPYDDIRNILYNPQGTSLAFIANRGQQQVVVQDLVESPPYDRVPEHEMQFSPDGKHFAYLGVRGHQFYVVIDGRESEPLPDVIGLSFSPSQQLAYMVRRNQRWTIVYGQQGRRPPREYQGVNGPRGVTFSPDGKTWVYQATTLQGERLIILEGAHQGAFPARELSAKPAFSPDGRRILFRTHSAQPYTVDVLLLDIDRDPALAPQPRTIHASEVYFTRDLSRFATVDLVQPGTGAERSYRVSIDGHEYPASGINIPAVTFSPRGTRFAIGGDQPLIDGIPIPFGQRASDFLFSADDRSYAYATHIQSADPGPRDVIVRDGVEVQSFATGGGHTPMAYSPDSRHLVYTAPHGPLHVALAVDGEEAIPIYDSIPYHSQIVFDAPNRLHTIAIRGEDVLLVELSWEQ
ncbi:MAG TPA: hypothetical protein VKU19_18330 [Bryobacteraceae bacterium]|nr:hypothetical protein [Bryobacteraceae bacterium]